MSKIESDKLKELKAQEVKLKEDIAAERLRISEENKVKNIARGKSAVGKYYKCDYGRSIHYVHVDDTETDNYYEIWTDNDRINDDFFLDTHEFEDIGETLSHEGYNECSIEEFEKVLAIAMSKRLGKYGKSFRLY